MTRMRNYLISGSKDKNLKLWDLDGSINNYRMTAYGHNDVNTIQGK
jgi:WD40 repeat protein